MANTNEEEGSFIFPEQLAYQKQVEVGYERLAVLRLQMAVNDQHLQGWFSPMQEMAFRLETLIEALYPEMDGNLDRIAFEIRWCEVMLGHQEAVLRFQADYPNKATKGAMMSDVQDPQGEAPEVKETGPPGQARPQHVATAEEMAAEQEGKDK
jgi:hypothetical protein